MVLLTSSQVSVAISSFIVFLFTTALFLSGYALQQQTVRDLRQAIKPQWADSQPLIQAPAQFDLLGGGGDVVAGGSDAGRGRGMNAGRGKDDGLEGDSLVEIAREEEGIPIPIISQENPEEEEEQSSWEEENSAASAPRLDLRSTAPLKEAEEESKEKTESRAERRKRIKEEIMASGEGENKIPAYMEYRRRRNSF